MASIDTRIETPITATELAKEPTILVASAASGVSALAAAAPPVPRPPTGPAAPLTTPTPFDGEAAGDVAAEEAAMKSRRRRATAKEVEEIGWDAMVKR